MAANKIQKYLEDILTSVSNIQASTAGLNAKHYSNYEVAWIVERGVEVIAEALKRIIACDPAIAITNAQKIIATRNKITHEYDVIDKNQLYIIVTKHLPVLKKEVEKLLSS